VTLPIQGLGSSVRVCSRDTTTSSIERGQANSALSGYVGNGMGMESLWPQRTLSIMLCSATTLR
jgi:hypothetical protein